MKKYVLIGVCNNEIFYDVYDNMSFAREEMRKRFSMACDNNVNEKIENGEAELNDKYDENNHSCWVVNGLYKYNWKIVTISVDKQ